MYLNRFLLNILSVLALASASALPNYPGPQQGCLSADVAAEIVNDFLSLIGNFNLDLANLLIADSFVDTSDSIDYLAGIPLGSPTFPSKAAFEAGAGSQGPLAISLIKLDAFTCDGVIAFRWIAYPESGQLEVKGINVLYTVNGGDTSSVGPGGWQISQVFSEFNSAAWIVDLGASCSPPAPPKRL